MQRGASTAEYGLLVAMIAVAVLGAVSNLARSVEDSSERAATAMERRAPAPGPTAPPAEPPGPGGGGSGGAATSSTTTSVPASTTTVPATTTTAVPTTTTTAAPTTTTPTTTTPPSGPATTAGVYATNSGFYWWNGNGQNGNGQWVGAVGFRNDWIRHQYLDLTVERVRADGTRTTQQVTGFYVPAGGTAEYAAWDNDLSRSGGRTNGVVEVVVTVTKVTSSDRDWQPVSGPGGTVARVSAPSP